MFACVLTTTHIRANQFALRIELRQFGKIHHRTRAYLSGSGFRWIRAFIIHSAIYHAQIPNKFTQQQIGTHTKYAAPAEYTFAGVYAYTHTQARGCSSLCVLSPLPSLTLTTLNSIVLVRVCASASVCRCVREQSHERSIFCRQSWSNGRSNQRCWIWLSLVQLQHYFHIWRQYEIPVRCERQAEIPNRWWSSKRIQKDKERKSKECRTGHKVLDTISPGVCVVRDYLRKPNVRVHIRVTPRCYIQDPNRLQCSFPDYCAIIIGNGILN